LRCFDRVQSGRHKIIKGLLARQKEENKLPQQEEQEEEKEKKECPEKSADSDLVIIIYVSLKTKNLF